ncbi:MAG: hypothetical protein JNK81_16385 [Anaerolineales bacterium]|nr:hypothetical protein [Anaerolineales bacterium]
MLISIPISDLKNPPLLQLPNRCVNCSKPKEEILSLSFDMGVQKKNQQVVMKISVPMCKTCADKERSIAKVTLIPFLIGGAIFGAIVFLPTLLIAPEGTTPQTLNFPFVFAGFIALIVGIIFGTIIEAIVKTIAIPVYGKLVTKRPLTIFSFFSNTDDLIGISAKFIPKEKLVLLEFENEDIASEFIKINHLENK